MSPLTLRLIVFISVLGIMGLWELRSPRRILSQAKGRRWLINLGIIALDSLILRLIPSFSGYAAGLYAQEKNWGLFHWIALPFPIPFVLGILILDFAVYLQHRLFHYIPLLWRIHRMHHTDLDFDVTTGVRFHPIEIILSMAYKMGWVLLFGIDPWAVVIFEIILNATSQFSHGNVKLPLGFDRMLRLIFVTPDMHRVHHSVRLKEQNSNFGFAMTWWDRLCRTYSPQPVGGHEGMEIGVTEWKDPKKLGFLGLLKIPFEK